MKSRRCPWAAGDCWIPCLLMANPLSDWNTPLLELRFRGAANHGPSV